ncbi:MAG: IS3 family transposase, partial [Butyrivibrio hungatei]|nr:IS3 family transposase [Butyrivibrio hungatei]
MKTDDGRNKGNISFYCRALEVSRQAFYDYIERKNNPWKYKLLADEMLKIHNEDEYNDCYGRERMYMALMQKKIAGDISIDIPCEGTVRKVMDEIGLIHKPRRKPNGITKADREARKSDDLLKRDFSAEKPLEKAVTDISEVKGSDGKVYVSAIFDCFD